LDLNREDKLLLKCLTARDVNGSAFGMKCFADMDWNSVFRRSDEHLLTPLLYQQLKGQDAIVSVPSGIMDQLRESYLRTAAANMRLYHELSKVLRILADNDIPVIVLKGAHLAELVYEDIGVRTMGDVDLLFKMEDLSCAQKKLGETGYYPYRNKLPLDINWSFGGGAIRLQIDIDNVWKRANSAVIAGVEVKVLCPEDLLLHICLHVGFQHLFELAGLRSLCDVREIVHYYQQELEWDVVHRRAVEWSVGNSLYVALLLATELLDARVPDSVMQALRPEDLSTEKKAWMVRQIFGDAIEQNAFNSHFCELWQSRSFRERVRSFRRMILPSKAVMSQTYRAPYRSTRNYASYLIHIKKNFLEYIGATLQILRRDKEVLSQVTQQNQNTAMREWLASN
jgi:hypothetical protein